MRHLLLEAAKPEVLKQSTAFAPCRLLHGVSGDQEDLQGLPLPDKLRFCTS